MSQYPVVVIGDATCSDYSRFLARVFSHLVGSSRLDVFIIDPITTSEELNTILTKYYFFLRNLAVSNGFDYRFDINIIFNQLWHVNYNWSVIFKPSGLTLPEVDIKVVEVDVAIDKHVVPDSSPTVGSSHSIQMFKTVALGGTFDHLHDGHKILLSTAVFLCKQLLIVGITGSKLLVNKKFAEVLELFDYRQQSVVKFLRTITFDSNVRFSIYEINDICGPTGYVSDIDALVVSGESAKGGDFVNNYRKEHEFSRLEIVSIDVIGGDDSNETNNWKGKLSSTDLRQKQLQKLHFSNR
jgi:pantetheine-phosphate adenylyltransferase